MKTKPKYGIFLSIGETTNYAGVPIGNGLVKLNTKDFDSAEEAADYIYRTPSLPNGKNYLILLYNVYRKS